MDKTEFKKAWRVVKLAKDVTERWDGHLKTLNQDSFTRLRDIFGMNKNDYPSLTALKENAKKSGLFLKGILKRAFHMGYAVEDEGNKNKSKPGYAKRTMAFDMTWYGELLDVYDSQKMKLACGLNDFRFLPVEDEEHDSEEAVDDAESIKSSDSE